VVPRFEPFVGLRYAQGGDLSAVACPPYDVVDAASRAELCGRSPHNTIRIELPESTDGEDAYRAAAELIEAWKTEGVLAVDPEPVLYAYRMTPPGEQPTLGYLGALGVTDDDGLLPHERTTPKAKSDRLDLLRATRTNTSPIWALSLAEGLGSLWEPEGEPLAWATDDDGVLHELWVVPADVASKVCALVSASPVAVADGHHRWETARNYLGERSDDPAAERIMAYVVELAPEQLQVRPIHRVLPSLVDAAEKLARWFEPADGAGEITLVTETESALRARPETREAADHDADAERLQVALDGLGETNVAYVHDEEAVREAVAQGAAAGVLLRAVDIDVIADVARAGERFPPKTTFFWPKPMTGFVLRPLD
jgi:uncharacterized protein (DUF1015 family)